MLLGCATAHISNEPTDVENDRAREVVVHLDPGDPETQVTSAFQPLAYNEVGVWGIVHTDQYEDASGVGKTYWLGWRHRLPGNRYYEDVRICAVTVVNGFIQSTYYP